MIAWLLALGYLAGLVVTARVAATAMIEHDEAQRSTYSTVPDAEDRIMHRVLGIFIGLLWPLVVVGALVTGRLPKSTTERRRELDERERRIAELERDLGITGGTDV